MTAWDRLLALSLASLAAPEKAAAVAPYLDDQLVDWELPPGPVRIMAGVLAFQAHARLHPDQDPARCECRYTWRRHPAFAKTRTAARELVARAMERCEPRKGKAA